MLTKYGGTWIDATVLLTDKIPDEILNSDLFIFKQSEFINLTKKPTVKLVEIFEKHICLSNWFIHSKPNNLILKYVQNFLEEYWKNENILIDYFLYHYIFTYVILNNKECWDIFNNSPSIVSQNQFLLGKCLFKPYDENLYNEIISLTSIHKLSHRYKKIECKNCFINKLTET